MSPSRWSWFLTAFAIAVVLFSRAGSSCAEPSAFPGRTWTIKAPEQVGMNTEGLKAFSDLVGGRGCAVRHGYMVYTWGDATKRGDVASACKPWFSHFLFKALEDGKLESVDERVGLRWEPRLNVLNADLGFKDREITWRHFATQTSCYEISDKPGTAYCYNDWQMALFWDLLFLKVYGATYDTVDEKVLHPLLTDELQCQDNPTFIAFGTNDRHGKRHWPDAPEDMYGCFGHGGPRVMVVIPSLDLVMSWNDAKVKSREAENAAFQRLARSVVR